MSQGNGTYLDLRLLGLLVRVETEDGTFLRDLARCFETTVPGPASPPLPRKEDLKVSVRQQDRKGGGKTGWELLTEPPQALRCRRVSRSQGAVLLTSELTQWAVANSTGHYVFHAGVVARDGRALMLPGGPSSGKTTLTAALVQRGFALLSDEVGAIAVRSGHLVDYPRSLSVRPDVLRLLGLKPTAGWRPSDREGIMLGVAELKGVRALGGAEPSLIIAPRFHKDEPTRLERLRPGPAVLALMEASCSQRRFKVAGLDLVIDLARRVPCFRLYFSDLATAIDKIGRAFAAASRGEP